MPAAASRGGEILEGKYRLLRRLGEGAMGTVYAGENLRIKKTVAIKVLHPAASAVAEMAVRFEREAQAAGQIGSDHITEVYDLGTTANGERYMVMEYLEGETLRSRIRRMKRLEPSHAVQLMTQLLEGLAAAHRAGVIHRDVKPDNVFILKEKAGRRDFVKILDFGISKFMNSEEASTTKTGTVMGSPNYMSPEHVRGTHEVDHQSDIYSVGVILYEALTGSTPRSANNFAELLFKIAYEPLPDPRDIVPELPASLAQAVMTACATDRAERFQDAESFSEALEEVFPAMDLSSLDTSVDSQVLRAVPPAPSSNSGVVARAAPPPPPNSVRGPQQAQVAPPPPLADSSQPSFQVLAQSTPSWRLAAAGVEDKGLSSQPDPNGTSILPLASTTGAPGVGPQMPTMPVPPGSVSNPFPAQYGNPVSVAGNATAAPLSFNSPEAVALPPTGGFWRRNRAPLLLGALSALAIVCVVLAVGGLKGKPPVAAGKASSEEAKATTTAATTTAALAPSPDVRPVAPSGSAVEWGALTEEVKSAPSTASAAASGSSSAVAPSASSAAAPSASAVRSSTRAGPLTTRPKGPDPGY